MGARREEGGGVAEFAVVIPTSGRRPAYLAAAVDSVIRQDLPAAEIVVVVDGDDAGLPSALDDGRVRVLVRPRRGVAAARNAGVAATRSAWLCFLDDDDLWHSSHLAALDRYVAAHPSCRALHAGWWTFSAAHRGSAELRAANLDDCLAASEAPCRRAERPGLDTTERGFELLLARSRVSMATFTVERTLLEQAGGFPEGCTSAEDWVAAIQVARYAEWHYVDERLAFVREHPGRNTRRNPTNDLVAICALRDVWEGRGHPWPTERDLASFGLDYRLFVQTGVWRALRRGRLRLAIAVGREGAMLLPRRRDRLVTLCPPLANRVSSDLRWLARHLTPHRARAPHTARASHHAT